MSTPAKLEHYLVKLENALGPIPITDKADIIIEIKSHVLDALKHDEAQSIDNILVSLGGPEQVANRYLLEKGLSPQKAPKYPIVKWLTIGFLGTLAICVIFIFLIVWKFTPIVKVNDENGRVEILGGLIDVKKSGVYFNYSDSYNDGIAKGTMNIDSKKKSPFEIAFQNGKMRLENSATTKIEWMCRGVDRDEFMEKNKDRLKFNFENSTNVNCSIAIPMGTSLEIHGNNGRIDFEKPHFHIKLKLTNGKIGFEEDELVKYVYALHLLNGKIDDFISNPSKDSYRIEMDLVNGKIEKD